MGRRWELKDELSSPSLQNTLDGGFRLAPQETLENGVREEVLATFLLPLLAFHGNRTPLEHPQATSRWSLGETNRNACWKEYLALVPGE